MSDIDTSNELFIVDIVGASEQQFYHYFITHKLARLKCPINSSCWKPHVKYEVDRISYWCDSYLVFFRILMAFLLTFAVSRRLQQLKIRSKIENRTCE